MTESEKLAKQTGITDADLLQLLLEDAESYVLEYTQRKQLPEGLRKTVRDLAVIAWHRMGTEGEAARSEGGESYTFADIPQSMYNVLNRYRLAKVGGKAYESET